MRRASERARAKVNLTLRILGKRPDGYHELSSLVAFADISDVVEVTLGEAVDLSVTGRFADALSGTDNLVTRAVEAFACVWPEARDNAFKLCKQLPVAAGLGGGSADAAAVLRLLVRASPQPVSPDEIARMATELGSDVPVCVGSRAAVMRGRGEHVSPVPDFPALPVVLVNPGIALRTADVFAALGANSVSSDTGSDEPVLPAFTTAEDVIGYMEETGNDLQAAAIGIAPSIGGVLSSLEQIEGCAVTRMSGSGPTCFGIFHSGGSADSAAQKLAAAHPEWWVRKSILS